MRFSRAGSIDDGLLACALLCGGLAGCDLVFPYAASDARGPNPRVADRALSVDGRGVEDGGAAPEAAVVADGPLGDGRPTDGVSSEDQRPTDGATSDGGPPDAGTLDTGVLEAGTTDAATDRCAVGVAQLAYSWPAGTMVVCHAVAGTFTQCDAWQLCAPSWHLCGATEYLQRGGAALGALPPAWIASCVRSGGAVGPPTDGACASCAVGPAPSKTVAWDCLGAPTSDYGADAVGVVSSTSCRRVGDNSAQYDGQWEPLNPDVPLARAVCCQ